MLSISHEGALEEALFVQQKLAAFGVKSAVREINLNEVYRSSPSFTGSIRKPKEDHVRVIGDHFSLVITSRDVYANENPDSWVFGYCMMDVSKDVHDQKKPLFVVCTRRLKGMDSEPLTVRTISNEEYLERVLAIALHEVAHVAVSGTYLKPTSWVGDNGFVQELGPHCTDHRCLLYEIVGISNPTDGWMKIGDTLTQDAGLAPLLERRYLEYFCPRCLPQVKRYLSMLK
ncbi:MAG: hypothetical protein AABY11_01285 [archaeon]